MAGWHPAEKTDRSLYPPDSGHRVSRPKPGGTSSTSGLGPPGGAARGADSPPLSPQSIAWLGGGPGQESPGTWCPRGPTVLDHPVFSHTASRGGRPLRLLGKLSPESEHTAFVLPQRTPARRNILVEMRSNVSIFSDNIGQTPGALSSENTAPVPRPGPRVWRSCGLKQALSSPRRLLS